MDSYPPRRKVEEIYEPYLSDVLDVTSISDVTVAYRESLELDGITFPGPELQKYNQQWDAYAAQRRGAVSLAEDGSRVDMSGFDRESDTLLRPENILANRNAVKLNTLVRLGMLSKAGDRFESLVRRADDKVEAVRNFNSAYKQYVQLAMAAENWASPWQDFVQNGFSQDGLFFPLSSGEIIVANRILTADVFKSLDSTYFGNRKMIKINIFNRLGNRVGGKPNVTEQHIGHVALLGTFYVHSPQTTIELVQESVEDGRLPRDVEWSHELSDTVNSLLELNQ